AWGASAGGHLAALLGTSGGVADLEGDGRHRDVSSRVQAVCDWFGPTDLLQMGRQAGASSPIDHSSADCPEALLVGGPVQQNRKKARRANPIHYVQKDSPPFLIVHGARDPLVPVGQSRLLHAALRSAGVDSTLLVLKRAGHGTGVDTPRTMHEIEQFFDR